MNFVYLDMRANGEGGLTSLRGYFPEYNFRQAARFQLDCMEQVMRASAEKRRCALAIYSPALRAFQLLHQRFIEHQ